MMIAKGYHGVLWGSQAEARTVVLRTPCLLQILHENNKPFKDGFLGTAPWAAVFPITALGALFVSGKRGHLYRAHGGRQEENKAMILPCPLSLQPPARAPEVQSAWAQAQPRLPIFASSEFAPSLLPTH